MRDYINPPAVTSEKFSEVNPSEPSPRFYEGSDLDSITAALLSPDFELTSDEAAVLLSAVSTAQAHGYPFDPFTLALVDVLRRQLADSDDGFEDGFDVADYEQDDTDAEPDGEQYGTFDPATRRRLTNGTMVYRKPKVRVA